MRPENRPAFSSLLATYRCGNGRSWIENGGDPYAFHEIAELLLFDGGAGFGGPGLDFTIPAEKNRMLAEDLQAIILFVGAPLCRRLIARTL